MADGFLFESVWEQVEGLAPAGRPLKNLLKEVRDLYLGDNRPWVIGFSGGKDSTAVLQLVYSAIVSLDEQQRTKRVFVVSSDTLVETPVVVDLLARTLATLDEAAANAAVPLESHQVTPETNQTFWVNLLGRGYPAPTKAFRWCTERMKINPVNAFILEKVAEFGEVIVILGARSAESATRAQVIAKHRVDGSLLGRHTSLPNAFVYTPIDDWTADEVWEYLMSAPRPWGGDNRALLELYRGSNAGECPIVIDTSTPSCGNSRFGCWTCTVVTSDRAMESLVEQGEAWMKPLLEFRNILAETTQPDRKHEFRNHRRRSGKVSFARGSIQTDDKGNRVRKHVPGSYWMRYRREWLERLLVIQRELYSSGHGVELITKQELHHIRREWLNDPNEPDWTDHLPAIYHRVFGEDLDWVRHDASAFTAEDEKILRKLGHEHNVPPTLIRKLLDLELSMDGLSKRRGIPERIRAILMEEWQPLHIILDRGERMVDGGFQEEIDRLQEALVDLDDGSDT